MAAPSLEKRLSAAADDSINQLGGSFRGSSMRVEKSKPAPGGWCQGICGGVPPKEREVDVILIGAGVMSATVGLMLKELEPNWKMMMFERLGAPGEESSNGFNNAGTGHAGFMEPNYTKEVKNSDGSLKTVTTDKVEHVCEQFLSSRQYWDYLTKTGKLPKPDTWIHQTNHIALGVGKDQVEFIKKRYEAMKSHPLFSSMEICLPEEKEKAKQWAPLIVKGRDPTEPICMTKVSHGTDVDYGALTKAKITAFQELGGDLRLHTEVTDLKKNKDGKWVVTTKVNGAGSGVSDCFATQWVYLAGWTSSVMLAGGYVAPPLNEKLDAWHVNRPEDGPMPTSVAAALAAQAMGFANANGVLPRDEGGPLRELEVRAAPRPASPARLLSWTAPPLSPRKAKTLTEREVPPADEEKHRSEAPHAEIKSFQEARQAVIEESRLPRPQVAIRRQKDPVLADGRIEAKHLEEREKQCQRAERPKPLATTPSSSSLTTSAGAWKSPRSRATSPRSRMSDVFYSQFSPTRYPETAAAAQRSPMRSAIASQGHPIDLVPKWQPPRPTGLTGRSKSPTGGRLPGWTRGSCRSVSPPGRSGLMASNDCLLRLRQRQTDEHVEDHISKLLAYEQKLTRQWTASEFRLIGQELRSPIYRDAAKSPSSMARRVRSPPRFEFGARQ